MTANHSEALKILCISWLSSAALFTSLTGLYAWSMQGPFHGHRYDPASCVSIAIDKSRELQGLNLAFFPNCETSESQVWYTIHSSSYCHLNRNELDDGEYTLLDRLTHCWGLLGKPDRLPLDEGLTESREVVFYTWDLKWNNLWKCVQDWWVLMDIISDVKLCKLSYIVTAQCGYHWLRQLLEFHTKTLLVTM
jgi:hypothetical protein